ncbi:ribonuclease P protein component [Mycolicibacterium bacteremicum]|uniref:ribonuclease P protein component n=1 Tax=Mycolicibacterium bacteremicum TaxID=564198 RepID=UPI0026F032E8|nr:ribonuclease P protein component [Mycolicibacterium bacteremicum]
MLPAQYRMTRSTDFGVTVRQGARAAQPDLVVHSWRDVAGDESVVGPKIGLVVSKSVGTAVQRHRVARRLRHAAYRILRDGQSGLEPRDRVVIRALPGSRDAVSARLETELRAALKRTQSPRQART